MKLGKAYYAGGLRIMKQDVPVRVAPWFRELRPEAQAAIGAVRICGKQRLPMLPEQEAWYKRQLVKRAEEQHAEWKAAA